MAEEVAPAPAPAATKPAKKKAPRVKNAGPSARQRIVDVVAASKERNGVSLAAVKKALIAGGYDVDKNKSRVRITIRGLVANGTLVQTKGTGASGSFKLNKTAEKPKKEAKKTAPIAKKPAAKKPAAAKKTKAAVAKKPVAKKSPKKAKKPAAAKVTKSPKKATKSHKSPKKVTKSLKKVTKSPKKATKVTKKAAPAKKAPAKSVKAKKTAAKKK